MGRAPLDGGLEVLALEQRGQHADERDDDGQHYLFYQGNNDQGKTWFLSVVPVDWKDGKPVLAEHKLKMAK